VYEISKEWVKKKLEHTTVSELASQVGCSEDLIYYYRRK